MSLENVEIARTAIEDFIAGKSEFNADGTLTRMAGEEHWHPNIELEVPEAVVPEMRGIFRGREAVRRWWGEWLGAWETVEFEYELLDAGNRVVALIDQRMRGRSTGIEVSRGKYAQVASYRDGLLVHWRFYGDQAEALEAAGLSEQKAPADS
jgi:ketosteroid isomerase-like protein